MLLPVKRLPHGHGLPLPTYKTSGAAGADLFAAIDTALVIAPGERALVPTGLEMALPNGYEGQLRPRSGLALNHGITVLNAPGTIDSDYRGEVKIVLINLADQPFTVERGMRIAQLVIAPVLQVSFEAADVLDTSVRGTAGFGSTGF